MFHPDNGKKKNEGDGALFVVAVKQRVIVLFVDKEELLTKPSVPAKNSSHFGGRVGLVPAPSQALTILGNTSVQGLYPSRIELHG